MTTTTKRKKRDKTIENVTFKVDSYLRPPKEDGEIFFLAKAIEIDEGYEKWLRIRHKGEGIKVGDILNCTVIVDYYEGDRPYHRIWEVHIKLSK